MADRLPQLLDRKMLAAEMGVSEAVADTIMRQVPKHKIGKRVFVDRADVHAYLASCRRTAEGFAA